MKISSKLGLAFILGLLIAFLFVGIKKGRLGDGGHDTIEIYGKTLASTSDLISDRSEEFESMKSLDKSDYEPKSLLYIQVHCTASPGELTKEWLHWFFRNERGWIKDGYNYVVHRDGKISSLNPINFDAFVSYDEISYGVRGRNAQSVHIAWTGGVDKYGKPVDNRTVQQSASLAFLISEMYSIAPGLEVLGHKDNPGVKKACPSFDVQKEMIHIIDFNIARDAYLGDFSENVDMGSVLTF